MNNASQQPEPRYTLQEAAHEIGMGERALFAALRRHSVLDSNNVPSWRATRSGYFIADERAYRHPTIGVRFYTRTLVTLSGLEWLRALLERPTATETEQRTQSLVREIARMNPDAGEIGAGKLHHIVAEARQIMAANSAS